MPKPSKPPNDGACLSFDSPRATGTGGAPEEADGLEWETVGDDGKGAAAVPSGPLGSSFMADATGVPRPTDWRERMKQRQRFWSQSHGFKARPRL